MALTRLSRVPLSLDFTPLDSSAVYVLSSMARRRRASRTRGDGGASPGAPHFEANATLSVKS